MIDGKSFISQINRGCDTAPDQESKPRQICPSAAANERFPTDRLQTIVSRPSGGRDHEAGVIMKVLIVWLLSLLSIATMASAAEVASVPTVKQTKLGKYFTSQEAASFMAQNAAKTLFLDIRTPAEVTFLGMAATADANVPYMLEPPFPEWDNVKSTFKLETNPEFIPEVRRRLKAKGLGPQDTVVLICRSGDRSAAASNLLAEAGFKNVYSIIDGYEGDLAVDGPKAGQRAVNGWKNAGLPWSYKLDRGKMYKLSE
jgi:rhodanese-related sulfurtransferase